MGANLGVVPRLRLGANLIDLPIDVFIGKPDGIAGTIVIVPRSFASWPHRTNSSAILPKVVSITLLCDDVIATPSLGFLAERVE
jgi:hypothetical protein